MPTTDDTLPLPDLPAKTTPPTATTPAVGKPIPAAVPSAPAPVVAAAPKVTEHLFKFSGANFEGRMVSKEFTLKGESRAELEREAKRLWNEFLQPAEELPETPPEAE